MITFDFDRWLTPREAAGMLRVPESTLETLAARGTVSVQHTAAGDRYDDREITALANEWEWKRRRGR